MNHLRFEIHFYYFSPDTVLRIRTSNWPCATNASAIITWKFTKGFILAAGNSVESWAGRRCSGVWPDLSFIDQKTVNICPHILQMILCAFRIPARNSHQMSTIESGIINNIANFIKGSHNSIVTDVQDSIPSVLQDLEKLIGIYIFKSAPFFRARN